MELDVTLSGTGKTGKERIRKELADRGRTSMKETGRDPATDSGWTAVRTSDAGRGTGAGKAENISKAGDFDCRGTGTGR